MRCLDWPVKGILLIGKPIINGKVGWLARKKRDLRRCGTDDGISIEVKDRRFMLLEHSSDKCRLAKVKIIAAARTDRAMHGRHLIKRVIQVKPFERCLQSLSQRRHVRGEHADHSEGPGLMAARLCVGRATRVHLCCYPAFLRSRRVKSFGSPTTKQAGCSSMPRRREAAGGTGLSGREQVRNVDNDGEEGLLYFLSYRDPSRGAFLALRVLCA